MDMNKSFCLRKEDRNPQWRVIDAEGKDDDEGSDDDDVATDDEIDDGEIDAEAEREMAEEVYKEIKGKVTWIVDVIL